MSNISDKETMKLYRNPTHQQVVKLRYASDYGHGFLGLFTAIFNGNIDEVIKDPGPPYVDERHIPIIKETLYNLACGVEGQNKPFPNWLKKCKGKPFAKISHDSLFE